MRNKFGIELTPQELREKEPAEIKRLLKTRAAAAYSQKETEYPVLTGLYRYSQRGANGNIRLDGDGLAHWAEQRFGRPVAADGLANGSWEVLRDSLVQLSQQSEDSQPDYAQRGRELLASVYPSNADANAVLKTVADPVAIDALHTWLEGTLGSRLTKQQLAELSRAQLEDAVHTAVEDRLHPEMRRMERSVLLNIVDTAWKDHLLAMDHLRSSVGLKGYAQLDPKVEYKREGMRLFERMWQTIGERTTDLVYRMESLNEDFVSSTWIAPQARHDAAPAVSALRTTASADGQVATARTEHEEAAARSQEGQPRVDPIRNRAERVGRNDACPCGSGKKYKNCCMRKESELI
jgi:preprotein translocase subunit SecA